ncbi:tripartite tricarboxylate transporter substrate binding protein [Burkholderia sp. R-69980]|nr:tripartite tricarboxylate transporter substrate binding protein [Burkholderia sp. R-69980]
MARAIAPYLSSSLAQTVVVDNKPGANGVIGMQEMLRSPPDGNTVLHGSVSHLALNVAVVKNLPYDRRRDLMPIAGVSMTNHVFVVKSSFSAHTFWDFITYAKQHAGLSVGYSTSLVQMQFAAMCKSAGVELLPVPYKGTPETLTDLLGGRLDATFLDPGTALTQVKGGQVRALAVSSLKRNPLTPDWPAISEALPGYDFSSWTASVGPVRMSRERVNEINAAINGALKQQAVVAKFAQGGLIPFIKTPNELKALIDTETAKWMKLASEANIRPE